MISRRGEHGCRGVAAATGTFGVGSTIKAGIDANKAKVINRNANEIVQDSTDWLNAQRLACGNSLSQLGEEKIFILNSTVTEFLDTFQKIKNVDFKDTEGFEELSKFHIDENTFTEMRSLVNFAVSLAGGAVAGTAGGAAVLGGLVAGPALMVMGLVAGGAAKKNLEKAYTNKSEAIQIASQVHTAGLQCETIRRRTYMFYNLLARLDTCFLPLIYKMEDIFENEGDDYRKYAPESKKIIASCASVAMSVKSVLDTPLLTDDGLLTEESEGTASNIEGFLENMRISI